MELERHLLQHGSDVGKMVVWVHTKFLADHTPYTASANRHYSYRDKLPLTGERGRWTILSVGEISSRF